MKRSQLLTGLMISCLAAIAIAQSPEPLQTINAPGGALAVSMDGKLAIGGAEKGPLTLVDFDGQDQLTTLEDEGGAYLCVDISGEGSLIATIRVVLEPHENQLSVWNAVGKKRLWETKEGASWARFTPDGTMVAAGQRSRIRFFDSKLGSVIRDVSAHDGANVVLGEFSRSGNLLVTAGDDDQKLSMWVVETGQNKGSIPFEGDAISALAVSDDGNLIAAAQGATLSVFDVKKSEVRWSRAAAQEAIRALDFRPRSIHLAVGGLDGAARIFSGTTGEQLELIEPAAGAVQAVRYSADGLVVYVGTPAATFKYSAKPRSQPDEVRVTPGQ